MMAMSSGFAALFVLVFSCASCEAKVVSVSNIKPKLDVNGAIVNGHDGTYRFFEGYWWYHAVTRPDDHSLTREIMSPILRRSTDCAKSLRRKDATRPQVPSVHHTQLPVIAASRR